jgi:mono/diheme cytochrome c family protein
MQRMGEVVSISTQFLEKQDLRSVATYLKSLDDTAREPEEAPETERMEAGEGLYFDNCAACHVADTAGVPYFFAPLSTSNKLHAEDASTVIRVILGGARAQPTETIPSMLAMPPFAWKLTDAQIADLLTYLRNTGDRKSGAVSADAVAEMREYLIEEH